MVSVRPAPELPPTRTSPRLSLPKAPVGTVYRGHEGMWSWVLHRITGVAIFFFLLVHIMDTALIRISPQVYDGVIDTYKNPIMGLGELALVAAVVFPASTGLPITLIAAGAFGPRHQRGLFWAVIVLWLLVMAGFVPRQVITILQEFPH